MPVSQHQVKHPDCHRHARVTIVALEPKERLAMEVQYNPAQLQLEEAASWTPNASRTDHLPPLEYASTRPRTLSLELFFDTYEEPDRGARDVKTRYVEPLSRLLQVTEPGARDERLLRPPLVKLCWGDVMPSFCGVVESLSTKLTMFLPDGTPVRATCALKLLEASPESFTRRPANRVAPPRR
jgi:hypothetical protein